MLALALAVHLAAASGGTAAPDPGGAPAIPASTVEGTGAGGDPLAARPALALPSPRPTLAPRLRGPFGGKELVLASLGAIAGDALVLGAGYGTLRLFANGTIDPNVENFRRAAYALAGAALVVPPLLAVLGARLVAGPRAGSFWKGLLLATAGQALAAVTGYWASPHLWAFLPAQLAAVSSGATLGLHWGNRERAAPAGEPLATRPPAGPPLASLAHCPIAG